MSIATSLTKLETDITNAYNTINTKCGTIPSNKNTNNLSTAIDSIATPVPITAFSIINNTTYGYDNHLITSITWKDVRKIEIWFKHLETKTNNILFAGNENLTSSISSPWISETGSGALDLFKITSKETVDEYTHQVMTFSTTNTKKICIGSWMNATYSSINAFKRIIFYDANNNVINDMIAAKMGNMIGFYDKITKGFYGINNFNAIVEGEYS